MTPSDAWGPIFSTVQERGLFADSKTFADAVPRFPPAAIMTAWQRLGSMDADRLRGFVRDHFELPETAHPTAPAGRDLKDHIVALWSALTRDADRVDAEGSLLPLPRRYVVPGGRFRELYYWDSYFTMLGLTLSGRQDLVEDMIADFGSLIDRFGHIPNGTRSYYLSRSHPPVFHLMAMLSADASPSARRRRWEWMRAEHAFWMAGSDGLTAAGEHRRVVRLADGALLNRYWDDTAAPRDESWREDVEIARITPERPAEELWRDLRAAAESGWDFSSRWFGDGRTLATIRTTRLLPIDLNALLFGLERTIADEAAALGENGCAAAFAGHAEARARAINDHLWDDAGGVYTDHDLDRAAPTGMLTAAVGFALFTGVAPADRAQRVADAIARLEQPAGLVTTLVTTGQQWDAPNGWAPLVWIATEGLRVFGRDALADSLADRWLANVEATFAATGQLFEKYDVERGGGGGGGEYGVEIGFGWTNGVALALMQRRAEAGR